MLWRQGQFLSATVLTGACSSASEGGAPAADAAGLLTGGLTTALPEPLVSSACTCPGLVDTRSLTEDRRDSLFAAVVFLLAGATAAGFLLVSLVGTTVPKPEIVMIFLDFGV